MTIGQITSSSSGIMTRKQLKDDTLHTTVTQEWGKKTKQGYKAEKKEAKKKKKYEKKVV